MGRKGLYPLDLHPKRQARSQSVAQPDLGLKARYPKKGASPQPEPAHLKLRMFHPCAAGSSPCHRPHGSSTPCPGSLPAASYLRLAKSLFHTDDLVAVVGAGDTAQYADADRVCHAVALEQFAMLGASPLCQNMDIRGLHQDMVFQGSLCAVLVQVRLAQGRLTAQAGLHRWQGLLKAEITHDLLVLLA